MPNQRLRQKRRTLAFETCESRRLLTAEVAFDLATTGYGSDPHKFVQISDDLMLFAADGDLWRSDGTDDGTVKVSGHNVSGLIYSLNDKAVFISHGGLTVSDGTLEGTRVIDEEIRDLDLVSVSRDGEFLAAFNGHDEHFRTDGTPEGTVRVRVPELDRTEPTGFTEFSDAGYRYFFVENQLWRTDGTTAGTDQVFTHPVGSSIPEITARVIFGRWVYYDVFSSSQRSRTLYRYDEVTGQNQLIHRMIGNHRSLIEMYVVGDSFFFFDNVNVHLATQRPDRIVFSGGGRTPSQGVPQFLGILHDELYFRTSSVDGHTIWRVDGTGQVREVALLPNRLQPEFNHPAVVSDGVIYFPTYQIGCSPCAPSALWRTDGTEEGTFALAEQEARYLSPVEGGLVFRATHPELGSELYSSDGTREGTQLLKDINPGPEGSEFRDQFFVGPDSIFFKGNLWFRATSELFGTELFRTDGTMEGTKLVADIDPTNHDSRPRFLQSVNGRLYHTILGNTNSAANPLYVSDGTLESLVELAQIDSSPLTSHNGLTWFTWDGELARTDGTAEGTFKLGVSASDFEMRTLDDGSTLFLVGATPWVTDGTREGTFPLEAVEGMRFVSGQGNRGWVVLPGNSVVSIGNELEMSPGGPVGDRVVLRRSDGRLVAVRPDLTEPEILLEGMPSIQAFVSRGDLGFFISDAGSIWRTDGTIVGSYRLDVATAVEHLYVGGFLFFVDRDGLLYRTDGTHPGTFSLSRQPLGDVTTVQLLEHDSRLIAIVRGSIWTSDGARTGTRRLQEFDGIGRYAIQHDGITHIFVEQLESTEWWQTDGTVQGTQRFDTLPQLTDAPVFHDGTLYFAAIHPELGDELWRYAADPEPEKIEGDVNGDGSVDVRDFLALSRGFGTTCEGPCDEDLNDDGQIDVADFLVLSRNFGRTS